MRKKHFLVKIVWQDDYTNKEVHSVLKTINSYYSLLKTMGDHIDREICVLLEISTKRDIILHLY